MPPILRVNTVAISTSRILAVGKRVLQDDVVRTLIDLDIGPEHLAVIQYLPHRQIVVVKFKKQDDYVKFLQRETVRINDFACRIYDFSSQFTMVTVMGAPFKMEEADLRDLLSYYGDVKTLRRRTLACETNKHFNVLPDGTWLASMEIKSHIPSYLRIHDSQLFIKYYGQSKTCRICGAADHLAKDCGKDKEPQHITSNDTDFPPLPSAHVNTDITQPTPSMEPSSSGNSVIETIQDSSTQDPPSTSAVPSTDDDTMLDQQSLTDVPTETITPEYHHMNQITMMPPPNNPPPKTKRQPSSDITGQPVDGMKSTSRTRQTRRKNTQHTVQRREKSAEPRLQNQEEQIIDMSQNYLIAFVPHCASDSETPP